MKWDREASEKQTFTFGREELTDILIKHILLDKDRGVEIHADSHKKIMVNGKETNGGIELVVCRQITDGKDFNGH